uniref:Uncharacterized protein n=1 Tax=Xiphophorus couchianus TaxID=32473 RepID=A0A3B5LBH5_9TELE
MLYFTGSNRRAFIWSVCCSSVLSSCEPELQELMKQIDIMISHQRREWQVEKHVLEIRVKNGEEGLLTSKNIIERRDLEIGVLQKQLEEILRSRQEAVAKYEQQLQKLREELDLLKGSYQKLQRKQLKQTSGGAKESDQLKYQRLSAEWEQQRAQYQKQLTTLEAENKSLTEEISHIKSAPWRVEQEHMECCLEVQHLGALLEKARSSLLSQEMELERLRPCEALLGASQPQQVSMVGGAHSAACTQRWAESQRLYLCHSSTTQAIGKISLEDCLAAQGCTGVEVIRKDLEKMADKLQGARAGEANLRSEVTCLKQRWVTAGLREELETARQTHSAEVEGVRREVSKLTGELHQRDVSISALSGSSASIQQQLRGEVQRAAEAATQLKKTCQILLLKVSSALSWLCCSSVDPPVSPQGDESSAALLQQRYLTSISSLEEENRQLRQALAKHHVQLDAQDETGPERNQHVALSHTTMTAQVDPGVCAPLHQEALSPTRSAVSRFLAEESLWSNELRLKLDSHIRGMKENNFRTVSRFLASGSGAPPKHVFGTFTFAKFWVFSSVI